MINGDTLTAKHPAAKTNGETSGQTRMLWARMMLIFDFNRISRILFAATLFAFLIVPLSARAQALLPGAAGVGQPDSTTQLPAELSPEIIDALMARLTDAEIRALLRDELHRRADEQVAAEAAKVETLADIRTRLTGMAATIDVAARLARADSGIFGMIAATLAIAAAGIAAAFAVKWASMAWRRRLIAAQHGGYWDRVVRTIALGLLELAPIFAFVFATKATAPLVAGELGPMVDYVWIYHVGVSYSWGFVVIARRAFAPDAPAIRIAHLTDDAAQRIYKPVRRAVLVGAAGWLLAGLSPTLGLGFPPAMVTVALAGTVVVVLLLTAAVRDRERIRITVSGLLNEARAEPDAFTRIAATATPVLLFGYLATAYLYWLAHWLERGQQQLDGPVGTLVLALTLPILDRLGLELTQSVIRRDTPASIRFREAFHGAWRMLIAIASMFIVAGLWGLDLLTLAKGKNAPAWADTIFDVGVTLLIVWLIWRLIQAALYTEPRVSNAGESIDPSELPAATRLGTLTPLFRKILLAFLLTVGMMIALSASGVDIGPLLASAGIIGIAVGFGAQALVRDVFSGAFFLIDDAFRVGEYIELDSNMRGEVESISVRSLQLRHHKGAVITIPFGEIKQITNHNRDWVIYKMMFRMEPDTDPVKFKKLVKQVGKEFSAHPEHGPKFLEPLKSQGVYFVDDDSALVFRVKFMCKPRMQFVLRREIYHRLREVFAEAGLRLARRKVEVVGADGEAAEESLASGALPDDILTSSATPGV
jgi:small-conductance mechanosensitive channel